MYFQSEPRVRSINWDQYKNLQYNEERSHSLDDLNKKTTPYRLEDLIFEVYAKNHMAGEKTRVMEIGAGNGRVLMELKKKFPDVEFYGVNKEKTHTFYRRESFIMTALKFEIFTKEEAEAMDLPYLIFQDLDFGGRLPYEANKFDLIYSQNTMKYIKYKFELFSEIMRVLKPNGVSFHTDLGPVNIYAKGLLLELRDAVGLVRKKGLDIQSLETPDTLVFKKTENNIFPLEPHQPIPEKNENISQEMRRPEMGYNFVE